MTEVLKDGIYEETTGLTFPVVQALVAGAFPVAPPGEWFDDPRLPTLTPLTVEESGKVFGHLASFDMPHIGLPGQVRAPRSSSGYRYFTTGAIRTAAGTTVPVGQLTLTGGHAPMSADASAAVQHYDSTESAVADVRVGEDRHGIWFAGALRPDVTPERLRTFMASALSGDWRPINGNLELVAGLAVNVPGFPIARAYVAAGAVMSMVAAGARQVAVKAASLTADAAVLERLDALENLFFADVTEFTDDPPQVEPLVVEPLPPVVVGDPVVAADTAPAADTTPAAAAAPDPVVTPEPAPVDALPSPIDNVGKARAIVAQRREQHRQALRDRVHTRKAVTADADTHPKAPAAT